jgi:serine/threonine protein kinase
MAIDPGTLIASRYRVEHAGEGDYTGLWLGTDEHTGQQIAVFSLPAAEAAMLRAATTVSHPHLAKLVEVVDLGEGSALVVTEQIAGMRLDARLAQIGKKQSVDAVRSTLRVADALTHLHAAGAVHGAVQPSALIVDPEGRKAPLLTFVPAQHGPYQSPERSAGPSEADDAWAVAGLLFVMLSGVAPPAAGVASEQDVVAAGIEDSALRAALLHALSRDRSSRSADLKPLKRELARWFAEHAGEEVPSSRPSARPPPPLPSTGVPSSGGQLPALATSTRAVPSAPKRRSIALLTGVAIAAGLAAAWGISSLRSEPVVVQKPAPKPSGPPEIALGEVPVTGQSDALANDKMQSCVAGFLPKDTFGKRLSLDWICTEPDPRAGGTRIRSAIVAGAPDFPRPTQTMKLFSQFGAYDMAVFALVRAGCCVEAKPLALPRDERCPDMAAALSELGRALAVAAGQGKDPALMQLTQAMECESSAGRGPLYKLKERPRANQRTAFLKLVELTQQP